jgi:hypothetical protein
MSQRFEIHGTSYCEIHQKEAVFYDVKKPNLNLKMSSDLEKKYLIQGSQSNCVKKNRKKRQKAVWTFF